MGELHLQLQYHQKVLKSKGDRRVFAKSHRGVLLTIDELKANLIEVISNNICDPQLECQPAMPDAGAYQALKVMLIQKREKDREGRMIAKEKLKLEQFKEDPGSLVGKRVQHKCLSQEGAQWFSGRVRDMVEMRDNIMRVDYNVVYDDYLDEVWTFNLLQDLKKGDLIVHG